MEAAFLSFMRLSNQRRTLAHVPGRASGSRNNASRRNVPATGANVAATWQRKKRPEGRFEIRSAFGAVDGNDHLAADSLESNVDPGVTRCEHGSEGVGPQFLKPGAVFVCLVLVHSEIGAGLVIQPLLKHTAQVRDSALKL